MARLMVDVRSPWSIRLSEVVSFFGVPTVTLPLRIAVVAALAWRRRWLQLTALLAVVVSSEPCIGPLAIAGAVTAFGLVVVLLPASPRRCWWIEFAGAFAELMALSRTVLGAHRRTDVVVGVCLGTGLALMWPAALELARANHYQRRSAAQPLGSNGACSTTT